MTDVFNPLKLKSSPSFSIARGNAIASGSPRSAASVDRRTARVAEAEEPGDLVERLAGGVVDRLPEQAVPPWPRISTSIVCPPETSSTTSGNSSVGSSRNAA